MNKARYVRGLLLLSLIIGLIAGYSRTVHAGGFAAILVDAGIPKVSEVSETPQGPPKYETIFEMYPEEFPTHPSITMVELSF